MDAWETVIASIITGVVIVVAAFFTGLRDIVITWLHRLQIQLRRRTYTQRVEQLARFLEVFEGLGKINGVDRAVIFHGHNCGGLPAPGRPYTVKAIHAWCNEPSKGELVERYGFELQVDVHYIRVLEDLVKTGHSIQDMSVMPEDSKLYDYYNDEGVKYSILYYLGIVDKELIFLSVASYTGALEKKDIVKLEFEVDHLRAIMEEEK